MRIYAVISSKGGVGKTFTTNSLATEFGLRGRKVLICDLDGSRNATLTALKDLSVIDGDMGDLFANPKFDPNNAIYKCSNLFPNCYIMAGSNQLEMPEGLVANRKNKELILKRALSKIKGIDDVLIDTPANLNIGTQNAIAACQAYITPIDHDRHAIDGYLGIKNLAQELYDEEVIKKIPKSLGFFFTKVQKSTRVAKMFDEIIEDLIHEGSISKKEYLKDFSVPHSTHPKEAGAHHSTLQHDMSHIISKKYKKICSHIDRNL